MRRGLSPRRLPWRKRGPVPAGPVPHAQLELSENSANSVPMNLVSAEFYLRHNAVGIS
jgi:hypothetical protein